MESLTEVFELVSEYCKGEMAEVAHNLWISDIQPVKLVSNCVHLKVRSPFRKKIVEEKYLDLLKEAFENVMGFALEVKIIVDPAADITEDEPIERYSEEAAAAENGSLPNLGELEYKFSAFIVGSSNKFAHAASLAVASNPAGAYNPLFIYGGSGLGKTHLLYAICSEIKDRKPQTNIIYVKGEDFTNELISAIQNDTRIEFRDKYRTADILLVDDIQFIGGKESTQEEFFHTFNTLHQSGRQIVLTSDRPPREIKILDERLRTRFEWGLIADIQPPDLETRIAIIRRKAELLSLNISEEVADYIANRLKSNIRQLEGAVKKIKAYKILTGAEPSILSAQNAIRDILNDNRPTPVTVDKIISEVGRTYSISPADIRSKKRLSQVALARKVSIYIVREITQMTMEAIGAEFGGRNYSTVVYTIKEVNQQMKTDPVFKEVIEDIIKNIRDN